MEVITAVGIDVSKGKSTVAAMRPGGEVVIVPYDAEHNTEELHRLARSLKLLDGEVRVVMEHTSTYYLPIATILSKAGMFAGRFGALRIGRFGEWQWYCPAGGKWRSCLSSGNPQVADLLFYRVPRRVQLHPILTTHRIIALSNNGRNLLTMHILSFLLIRVLLSTG